MRKYSPEENMKIIAQVSEKYGINPCFMITKAKIESNLNNLAKNGKYWGLFQLNDGVGGVKGEDRLDPYKATEGAIKYLLYNKSLFEKKFPQKWQDWYGYLMHQQGAAGFMSIFASPDTLINESPRKKAILANSKKEWLSQMKTHKDFIQKWQNTFDKLNNQCLTEYSCFVSNNISNEFCPTDIQTNYDLPSQLKKEGQIYDITKYALIALAGLGIGYFIIK